MREPEGDTDGLVGALGERLSAGIDQGATTLRLALAETRLAATSAAMLVGIALGALVLALLVWLLLVALAGYGMWLLGASPGWALLILLGAHLIAAAALGLLARRLVRDLRFDHTRRALADARLPSSPGFPDETAPVPPDMPAGVPPDVPPVPASAAPPPPGVGEREATRQAAREARESVDRERG